MVTDSKRSGVCIVATALGAQEPRDVAGALRGVPWEVHVDYRRSDQVTRLLQQKESFQAFLSLSIIASFPRSEFHKERSPQQETGPCSRGCVPRFAHAQSSSPQYEEWRSRDVFLIDKHGVRLSHKKALPLTHLEVRHHLKVAACLKGCNIEQVSSQHNNG
jgi:hypothetical protein